MESPTTKTCSKCAADRPIDEFYVNNNKPMSRCKECVRAAARGHFRTSYERYKEYWKTDSHKAAVAAYKKTAAGRFRDLVENARRRGLDVTISREEHAEIIKRPCSYCGTDPTETGTWTDRCDSNSGYVPGNVVPCCFVCNVMKSCFWTHDEFLKIGDVVAKLRYARMGLGARQPDEQMLENLRTRHA